MVRITEVTNAEDVRRAQVLLREFTPHQREHYVEQLDTVIRYFDLPAYEKEVSDLHAYYPPPRGCVLLATDHEEAAGVICLRPMDEETCEMKRLFVPIAHRRKGIAQALCATLIDTARQKGYTTMRLDTGAFMTEPQALYRKLGFTYMPVPESVSEELRAQLVFMQLHL